MEEVMRKEQEGGAEKSESCVIEGEVVIPRIKGFKARDKKQKMYDAENVSEVKLIAKSHNKSEG
jgi:hypothetical protein